MQSQINKKVAVITGASSGIGKAVAIELAKNGVKVVLGARRIERLKSIVEEIRNRGGEAVYQITDVKIKADLVRLVAMAIETYGQLDVMINNAGVSQLSKIEELDIEGWEEMIDINVKGVLYGMAAAVPVFKENKSGYIINIISTAGIRISPMMGVYAGTKNAVRTITEAFRQESDGRIRITGISPGFVNTDFADNIKNDQMRRAILQTRDQIAISPQAIADAVIYAISQPKAIEIGDIIIRPAIQN